MPDLLIELFSEEIPARMQARAAADLKKLVTDGLVEAGLTYESAGAFHTPRRLALSVEGLLAASPNTREERKGPRLDAPEKALEGFLRSTGLTKDQLEARDDKKGQVWYAVIEKPGRAAAEIVAEVLEQTIRNFPWPKSMRWGAGALRWVRPLHSILCILSDEAGAEIVPLDIDGIAAGNTTQGHRFMAPAQITVNHFEGYSSALKKAYVILDAAERAEHIWADATNMAFAQGLEVVEDKGLLAEVSGLVEWPVVLMGDIGEEFLGLPPEVLQTSMKEHQKFFSVKNPKTGRIEKFITVANRETADHGKTILAGNQKVLAARLSDAKFFWENDLRTVEREGMKAWTNSLANVTFHAKLGSQAERIDRIAALAREIAPLVGAKPDLAEEAARVAKADLGSEMVYEFPELQGVMGTYYARAAGHNDGVPEACAEHYSPLGPSDDVPTAPVSVAVALADKIDTLTGFWAIDEKPTGSKDPYALRRAALGVIRLVLENGVSVSVLGQFSVSLASLFVNRFVSDEKISKAPIWVESIGRLIADRDFANALLQVRSAAENLREIGSLVPDVLLRQTMDPLLAADLLSFFHDRLKVYLRDRGIRHDVIDACLAMPGNDDLTLLVNRATALSDFLKTEDGENLLQGFKRANNILTQAESADGVEYSYGAEAKFAENDAEKALFAALAEQGPGISSAIEAEDFAAAMAGLAKLRAPLDGFFEAVQVNTDNQVLRRNRLNLLSEIRSLCLAVADLGAVEG
jgi:glycyl-tRNA synthetase beta chain